MKTGIDLCGYNCLAILTCKEGYFAERKTVPVVCQMNATFNDSLQCYPGRRQFRGGEPIARANIFFCLDFV